MPGKQISNDDRAHLIIKHSLSSPHLRGRALRNCCEAAAAEAGCSLATAYRWRQQTLATGRIRRGLPASAGRSRVLAEDVLESLAQLRLHPASQHLSDAELARQLAHRFPAATISYSAVRRARRAVDQQYQMSPEPSWRLVTSRVNQQWQIDDSTSDLFVQFPVHGRPRRVPLSAVIDAHTRCFLFAQYVSTADQGSYATLMFHAMRRSEAWPMHGVPESIRDDHGKVFGSDMARRACEALGIVKDTAAPYHPQGKARIERSFRTIHETFERLQPGFCGPDNTGENRVDPDRDFQIRDGQWWDRRFDRPLHTLETLNAGLVEWTAWYHARQHDSLGMSPESMWGLEMRRHPQANVEPAADVLFQTLLTPVDRLTRRVDGRTVSFQNLPYEHELLAGFAKVLVRYAHHDLSRVWCFDERGALICEATLLPEFMVNSGLSRRDYQAIKRRHRAQSQAERAAIDSVLSRPHAAQDLHDRLHEAAAGSAGTLAGSGGAVPAPSPWSPPVDPEQEKLSQVTIGGIPLRRAASR